MPFSQNLRMRRKALLVAIEATSGSGGETLGPSDVVYVDNAVPGVNPGTVDRDELGSTIDAGETIVTSLVSTMTTDFALRGSGVAGTPPSISPLLIACGFNETIVAGTSVTYVPHSNPPETLQMRMSNDGIFYEMVGMAGAPSFTFSTGGVVMASCNWSGTYHPTTAKGDAAMPAVATSPASALVPRGDVGGVFTIGGTAAAVSNFTLDVGNEIANPQDINAPGGIQGASLVRRNMTGSMNPLETLVATRNLFATFRAGTTLALVVKAGATAGNIVTLNATVKLLNETEADDGGFVRRDYPFQVRSGFSLVFT
jgi:Phage tail tube protein